MVSAMDGARECSIVADQSIRANPAETARRHDCTPMFQPAPLGFGGRGDGCETDRNARQAVERGHHFSAGPWTCARATP